MTTAQGKQQAAPIIDKKKTKAMNALFSGISGDKKSDSDSDSDEDSPVKIQVKAETQESGKASQSAQPQQTETNLLELDNKPAIDQSQNASNSLNDIFGSNPSSSPI